METTEKYLGAVRGSELKKGLMNGYALYVTTNRIIGHKEHRDIFLEGGKGPQIGLARHEMDKHDEALKADMEKGLGGDQMKKILDSKDLEIKKSEIKAIQLKRNIRFEYGYIKFQLRSGNEIEIRILPEANLRPGFFEKINDLMHAFYPEVLELQD